MEEEKENENEVVKEMEREKEKEVVIEEEMKKEEVVMESEIEETRSSSCVNVSNSTQVEGVPKRFGLKRWRRHKRDSSNLNHKDQDTLPHSSRLLKRSSSPNNFIHPTHAPNPNANFDADASMSSTNANVPTFAPGPAESDNSDDRSSSSKSSTAASAPKRKHRLKSLNHPKPNPNPKPSLLHSSNDFQPHSPSLHFDYPFSSLPSIIHLQPSFTQQHSHPHFTSTNPTHHHSPIPISATHLQPTADPLVHSIHMLHSAHLALQSEVERFKELGREIGLLSTESNEKDGGLDGWRSEVNHMYSNKNVVRGESEGEGRVKEREMKNDGEKGRESIDMEGEVERMVKERMEAEIEHVLITRCSMELIDQINKVMRDQKDKEEEEEEINSHKTLTNLQNNVQEGDNIIIMSMRSKALTSAKCFAIQLSLLLFLLPLFISRLTPFSPLVVPT